MARLHPSFLRWTTAFLAVALSLLWSCDSPTQPDGRTGQISLAILCDGSGAAPLRCSATTYCAGLYPCPDLAAGGSDVTRSANWSSANASIARPLAPGGPFGGQGYFRILGVTPGAYTPRVVADGFVTQERTVVVPARGSPAADFQMVRSDVATLPFERKVSTPPTSEILDIGTSAAHP